MKGLKIAAVSLVAAGSIAAAVGGVASAATTSDNTGMVGKSGIARTTFKQDRLDAEAKVLNTSTDAVLSAHKDKTLGQLLVNAGLTHKTFAEKVKAELTSELQSQGYSQDQITIALQHREIVRLRHS